MPSKIVRVTLTQDYYIEDYITYDQIKEWFEPKAINISHATRDYFRVGGSKKLVKIKTIDSSLRD